jgi:CHAT domain-containing protein
MSGIQPAFALDAIVRRIFELRGQRVMLDADLAADHRLNGVKAFCRLLCFTLCLLAGFTLPSFADAADAKRPTGSNSTAAQKLPPCLTSEMLQKATGPEAAAYWQEMMPVFSRLAAAITDDDFAALLASITPQMLEKDRRFWGEKGFLHNTYNALAAMQALHQGRIDAAVDLQTKEIARRKSVFGEHSPCAQEAESWLIDVSMRLTEFDRALELIDGLLRKSDNHAVLTELHRYRCIIALRRDDPGTAQREALAMLEEAKRHEHHELTHKQGAAWALLAYAHARAGEREKAAEASAKARKLGEEDKNFDLTPLALHMAVLTTQSKYPDALGLADKLITRERRGKGMTGGLSLPAKACVLSGMRRYAEAFDLRLQALDDETRRIVHILSILPDSAARDFMAASRPLLLESLDAGVRRQADDPARLARLYGVWLQRKGLLLEQQRRYQAYQFSGLSEEGRQLKAAVDAAKQTLFAVASSASEDDARLAPLHAKLRSLEERFKKLHPDLLTAEDLRRLTPAALAAVMPSGSVLIDFARALDSEAREKDFRTPFSYLYPPASVEEEPQVYLAFILHPGDGSRLAAVRLGDAKAIDTAVAAFRRAVARDPGAKGANIRSTGAVLSRLLFAPLRSHLAGAKTIYLSPDGQLNLLPFEALQDMHDAKDGAWLLDSHSFRYLAAARDLLRPRTKASARPPLFLGNPDFNCVLGTTAGLAVAAVPLPAGSRAALGEELPKLPSAPLPAALRAITEARTLLGGNGDIFSDCAAGKGVLRNKAPRLLHLATHGFFLPDETDGRNAASLAMRRSGLALAGANAQVDKEAALLMAEEVLGVNLDGTELVVLSACQTGLGEVRSGEGVYGLRRAFSQAGAAAQIMSLWSVPDKETQELMQAFYRALRQGARPGEALREAAAAQKTIVTGRYGFAHPFYWGAFVYLGTE